MAEQLLTKDDVLNKLRAYGKNPDDDVIRIKNILDTFCCIVQNYYMHSMLKILNPSCLAKMGLLTGSGMQKRKNLNR